MVCKESLFTDCKQEKDEIVPEDLLSVSFRQEWIKKIDVRKLSEMKLI